MPNNPYETEEERIARLSREDPTGYESPYVAPPPYQPTGYQIPGVDVAGAGQTDLTGYMGKFNELTKQGWYKPAPGYLESSVNPYTGRPQTFTEAKVIRDFFDKYGRLPSTSEAGRLTPSQTSQDVFMSGSTPYEMGHRTMQDWIDAQARGEFFGPYPGVSIPEGTTVAEDYAGGQQRFARSEVPQGYKVLGQEEYPYLYRQPQPKPFEKPPILTIQQFAEKDPMTSYRAMLMDYLDALYPKDEKGLVDEKYNQVTKEATEKLAMGVPVEQMPLYQEMKDIIRSAQQKLIKGEKPLTYYELSNAEKALLNSPTLQGLYQSQYLNNYNQMVAQSQAQYNQSIPTPMGIGGAGRRPQIPQISPQQIAEQQNRPNYTQWVDTMPNLDEKNRIWLYENYTSLIGAWQTYGQGKDFITWVKKYLEGNYPPQAPQVNEARFSPNVRYSR